LLTGAEEVVIPRVRSRPTWPLALAARR
jgi:hypothetical protein